MVFPLVLYISSFTCLFPRRIQKIKSPVLSYTSGRSHWCLSAAAVWSSRAVLCKLGGIGHFRLERGWYMSAADGERSSLPEVIQNKSPRQLFFITSEGAYLSPVSTKESIEMAPTRLMLGLQDIPLLPPECIFFHSFNFFFFFFTNSQKKGERENLAIYSLSCFAGLFGNVK